MDYTSSLDHLNRTCKKLFRIFRRIDWLVFKCLSVKLFTLAGGCPGAGKERKRERVKGGGGDAFLGGN